MPDATQYSREEATREAAREARLYLKEHTADHLERQMHMGVDYELGVLPPHANGAKERR